MTASRTDPRGQAIRSVQYQDVGLIIRLAAPETSGRREKPDVKVSLELSALTPSEVELTPGTRAMTVRNLFLEHREPLEFGQARVALAISSASANEQAPPIAHVVRYLFNPPGGR